MSVEIRLRRAGTNKKAFFHVVATDSKTSPTGRFIEKLGHYDPQASPTVCTLDHERIGYWLSVGAQTSQTVLQLLKKSKAAQEGQGEQHVDG